MVLVPPQSRENRYQPYSRQAPAGSQPQATDVTPDRLQQYKLDKEHELRSLFTSSIDTFVPISTSSIRAKRAAAGYHDRQAAAAWNIIGLRHLGYFSVSDTKRGPDAVFRSVWNSREPVQDFPTSRPVHSLATVELNHRPSASEATYLSSSASECTLASPSFEYINNSPVVIHDLASIEPNDDSSASIQDIQESSPIGTHQGSHYITHHSQTTESTHDLLASSHQLSPTASSHDPLPVVLEPPAIRPHHDESAFIHGSSPPDFSHNSSSVLQCSPSPTSFDEPPTCDVEYDSSALNFGRRTSSRQCVQKHLSVPTTLLPREISRILRKAYDQVVRPQLPEIVKCKATSLDETYGEIMPVLIRKLLRMVKLTRDSQFVDLGSGTGTVVLQVAMTAGCRSFGIECVKVRAKVAQEQLVMVKRLLGKKVGAMGMVELVEGDMIENHTVQEMIGKADLVLANNLKFESPLNNHISNMLLKLKAGAYVISLEEVGVSPRQSKASARDEDSLGSQMSIFKHRYAENSVSWKAGRGTYLLHVMQGNK